jgi:putative ABC transport system substrate-binding protein
MKRREFITLLGGAAATWPLAARAQQGDGMRRIGVLIAIAESDPEAQARVTAFSEALRALGWVDGRNARLDVRYAAGDPERMRTYAAELVGIKPDVILVNASAFLAAVRRETRTVPIVFVQVADPVGGGFVDNLARPGGNVTGFASTEYEMGGKWLDLLKEIAPAVTRVAVLRDPTIPSGAGQLGAIQAVAPSFRVTITPTAARDAGEIERAINTFASGSNGGLIVLPSALTALHRQLIVDLAARHRLPVVYPYRYFATRGGLVSYGLDNIDLFRRAAGYVDRILKGEKPADMPVQAPTKYELVINLKTAKALGLTIPPMLLARADEVIE